MAEDKNTNKAQHEKPETEKTTKKAAPKKPETEEIFIPRAADASEEKMLFVSVNGKSYLLPKGKTSVVPKAIAYEIRRAMAAQNAWDDRAETMAGGANATALK